MSLSTECINRIFARLTATYGRQFTLLYEGVDPNAVKAAWGHELASFRHRLEAIAWALENLPDTCPNAVQFRKLCRQAPIPDSPMIESTPAAPQRIREEIAKLGPVVKDLRFSISGANRAWAHRIVAKAESGATVSAFTLKAAREALGGIHGAR